MHAIEAATASDTHCGTKSLGNQVAGFAVLGCVPVFSLVLNFAQRGIPAGSSPGRECIAGFLIWFEVVHVRSSRPRAGEVMTILASNCLDKIEKTLCVGPIESGRRRLGIQTDISACSRGHARLMCTTAWTSVNLNATTLTTTSTCHTTDPGAPCGQVRHDECTDWLQRLDGPATVKTIIQGAGACLQSHAG